MRPSNRYEVKSRNIMAALVEQHNYDLSSQESTSAGKTLVHVKLTDSALKSIEEFLKIQVGLEA